VALGFALAAGLTAGWLMAPTPRLAVAQQFVNPLPAAEHQQLVTGRCIICHSLETIAQQRQTREEWAVILDRMITYGMPMLPGDREIILNYLARYLGQ
jgi:hypothetical protein